mgnify:CR=1 FL=1
MDIKNRKSKKRSLINKGKIISLEQRKKLSISKTGLKLSFQHKQNISKSIKKIILQYDLNLMLIKEWKSSQEAALALNIDINCIRVCCRQQRKTYKKYIWKYKE